MQGSSEYSKMLCLYAYVYSEFIYVIILFSNHRWSRYSGAIGGSYPGSGQLYATPLYRGIGGELPSEEEARLGASVLEVDGASVSRSGDGGTYVCTANNSLGSDQVGLLINIFLKEHLCDICEYNVWICIVFIIYHAFSSRMEGW